MNGMVHSITIGLRNISDWMMEEFSLKTFEDEVLKKETEWYKHGCLNKCNGEGELQHYFKI